jgi:hypothetical protein
MNEDHVQCQRDASLADKKPASLSDATKDQSILEASLPVDQAMTVSSFDQIQQLMLEDISTRIFPPSTKDQLIIEASLSVDQPITVSSIIDQSQQMMVHSTRIVSPPSVKDPRIQIIPPSKVDSKLVKFNATHTPPMNPEHDHSPAVPCTPTAPAGTATTLHGQPAPETSTRTQETAGGNPPNASSTGPETAARNSVRSIGDSSFFTAQTTDDGSVGADILPTPRYGPIGESRPGYMKSSANSNYSNSISKAASATFNIHSSNATSKAANSNATSKMVTVTPSSNVTSKTITVTPSSKETSKVASTTSNRSNTFNTTTLTAIDSTTIPVTGMEPSLPPHPANTTIQPKVVSFTQQKLLLQRQQTLCTPPTTSPSPSTQASPTLSTQHRSREHSLVAPPSESMETRKEKQERTMDPQTKRMLRDAARRVRAELQVWWSLGYDPMQDSLRRVLDEGISVEKPRSKKDSNRQPEHQSRHRSSNSQHSTASPILNPSSPTVSRQNSTSATTTTTATSKLLASPSTLNKQHPTSPILGNTSPSPHSQQQSTASMKQQQSPPMSRNSSLQMNDAWFFPPLRALVDTGTPGDPNLHLLPTPAHNTTIQGPKRPMDRAGEPTTTTDEVQVSGWSRWMSPFMSAGGNNTTTRPSSSHSTSTAASARTPRIG